MLQVLESLLDDLEILPTRLQKKAVSLLSAESCVNELLFRAWTIATDSFHGNISGTSTFQISPIETWRGGPPWWFLFPKGQTSGSWSWSGARVAEAILVDNFMQLVPRLCPSMLNGIH